MDFIGFCSLLTCSASLYIIFILSKMYDLFKKNL